MPFLIYVGFLGLKIWDPYRFVKIKVVLIQPCPRWGEMGPFEEGGGGVYGTLWCRVLWGWGRDDHGTLVLSTFFMRKILTYFGLFAIIVM
jgi:hypothetical protein